MRIPLWAISPPPPVSRPPTLCKSFSRSARFLRSASSTHDHPTSWGVTPNPSARPTGASSPSNPFIFQTAFAAFAKRPSRAFPPPFTSRPSASFSDPLTTYAPNPEKHGERERLLGLTNGDDALIVRGEAGFLGVLDGVGAWAVRERDGGKGKGNAALWSRLVGHFWAKGWGKYRGLELRETSQGGQRLIDCLQVAYEETKRVTHAGEEGEVCGTTTACAAALGWQASPEGGGESEKYRELQPVLYAANLGDCAVLVIRPSTQKLVYKSTEQWHWFDCPRQLGTNSPDTPVKDAVVDTVPIEVGDVVLVVSDGVSDNLWDNEICRCVCDSLVRWEETKGVEGEEKMVAVARELMEAARAVAMDPFAESPFMERAVEEGLPMEGGKMDDISVVVGMCGRGGGDE